MTGKTNATGELTSQVQIAYVGTATYDLAAPRQTQTHQFISKGCTVVDVTLALPHNTLSKEAQHSIVESSDIILVSGGNTLFAMNRWRDEGFNVVLKEAAATGKIICGGSAGAICWFDGGHSDSMDPETYCNAMLSKATDADATSPVRDDCSLSGVAKQWRYIRVPGLGVLPGIFCPHHDRVQSNGVLRALDFDEMLLRHRGERGIALDHFAAIVIDSGKYSLFRVEGKSGSDVGTDSPCFDCGGLPGLWIKFVDDSGRIRVRRMEKGPLEELLAPAKWISFDPLVETCSLENPSGNRKAAMSVIE
jgi:dipeptidase E